MQVERVQKWIISSLVLTTAAHFAGGLVLLALTVDNPGAFPVLTGIATIVSLLAIVGTRVINNLSLVTPWLLTGLLPLALGLYFH